LERQITLHAENPRGLLRAPDEFVALLGSLGQYKGKGDGDRGTLLRLFEGEPITVDRVKNGGESIHAETALLGVLAGTQPGKIQKLATDLGEDGFLQRILFLMDDGTSRPRVDDYPDAEAN
jgi:hypothetical protein